MLDRAEVDDLFPDAAVLLEMQAPHIAERDDVQFWAVVNKSKFTVNGPPRMKLHARTSDSNVRVYFDERVNVWLRYSCGVASKPRREVCRPYCIAPMPLDLPVTMTTTATLTELVYSEYIESVVEMYSAHSEPSWAEWVRK